MKGKHGKKMISIALAAILLGSVFTLLPMVSAANNGNVDTELRFGKACDLMTLDIEGILKPSEGPADGYQKTVEFHVDKSECEIHPMPEGYVYLRVGDLKPCTAPGEPKLPMKTFVIKLPKEAEIINVAAINGEYLPIDDELRIIPTREPYVWSVEQDPNAGKLIPNEEIYNLNSYFPGKAVSYDVGCDNEYKYVFVRIYPAQFIPAQQKAILIEDITVNVYYSLESPFRSEFRSNNQTSPECVILAPESLFNSTIELAEYHNSTGVNTSIITTEEIWTSYTAAEDPPYPGYKEDLPGKEEIHDYNYTLAKKIITYFSPLQNLLLSETL
jgi:hypothetical protein